MDIKKNEKLIKMVITITIVVLLVWFIIVHPLVKFKSMENKLIEASKRYFEINDTMLPTGNKIRKISLQTLYDKDFVKEDLRAPYTNKYCNAENSWVRVSKNKGKYQYNAYLECGLFKSKIDHKGPEINLNGNDTVVVYQGNTYKDAGIKSVIDDTDGKIDINKVKIDATKVNTNKVGIYKVTYTVSDSLENETVKVRTVKVTQTLNNIVKNNTDKTNIYKGSHDDNYVMVDGIIFKIVGINKDYSVKIVSNEPLASVDYDGTESWLNEYFYEKLSDNAKEYIVKSKWCNETVNNPNNYSECSKYTKKQYVGLLSIEDYNNAKDENNDSNFHNDNAVWTYNIKDKKEAWISSYYNASSFETIEYYNSSKNTIIGIKPALNIKANAVVVSGDGSNTNPYILKNNNLQLKKGSKISEALTGSYIQYSGYTFRVISKEDDGTTKVIMVEPLKSSTSIFYSNYDTEIKTYNPNRKTNLGYQVINKAPEFIKTNYFVSKKFEIKSYGNNVLYKQEKSTKKYEMKLSVVSLFDLYSAHTTNGISTWYQENSDTNVYLNSATVGTISEKFDANEMNGIKLVGYLNKNVVVKSGDGSKFDPYILTK